MPEISERMCFYPDSVVYSNPRDWGLQYEDFFVNTPDGDILSCWHIHPAKNAEKKKACILHLHGNAQNMTAHVAGAIFLAKEGYRLVTFDYRGYGGSSGMSTLASLVVDAKAVLEKLFNVPFGKDEDVFGFGQSMGAYTLSRILPEFPKLKGVVIEAGLISFYRVFAESFPANMITIPEKYELTTLPGIKASKVPKLFIHGTADGVVPYQHTEEMFEVASEPKEKLILDGVGHIDALNGSKADEYKMKVFEFLTRV